MVPSSTGGVLTPPDDVDVTVVVAMVFVIQLVLLVTVHGVAALGLASAISSITRELFTAL